MLDLAQAATTAPSGMWTDILAGIAVIMSTALGGLIATEKIKARKSKAVDNEERTEAGRVLQHECDRRHADLDRLIDGRHTGLEAKICELKLEVTKGFDRVEKALENIRP